MRRELKGIKLRTGFWALFDQGAVSLGNFLTQMLLARKLSWSDYGVFALVYGVLFFLINSVGTVVTYPLSVKGASVDSRELSWLAGASVVFDAGLLLPEAAIVFCAVTVLHRLDLFAVVLLALAFWQFQETMRRALMARLGHREAAWGDALSYLGQAAAILVLAGMADLTLESAFMAIATTSAAAVVVQLFQVKPRFAGAADARALAGEYWHLGAWSFSTNVSNGLTQQAFPWVLGLLFGTAEAGSFQAVVNLLKVFNPVIVGAQNLIVPAAAKTRRERGVRAASRSGLGYAVGGALLFLPYLIVLLVWPHGVLGLLYGFQSPYSHLELALRLCVFAYAFGYWAEIVGSLLNGLGLPKGSFLAQLGATGTAICVGLPMAMMGGVAGALGGLGICALVKAGISLYAVWAGARGDTAGVLAGRAAL
ncbi:MAG TPA: hypothetical protein VNE63_08300 [Candidatus Acidoferrales bacterium]|nr:hypothetical protein [Candidatus Acidoferrales bacterium]